MKWNISNFAFPALYIMNITRYSVANKSEGLKILTIIKKLYKKRLIPLSH